MLAEYALCVVGIYSCFLTWGVLQERVTTTPYGHSYTFSGHFFKHFIVLNLCQALCASLVGTLYLIIRRQSLGPRSPAILWRYIGVALFNSLASPFGYAALKYIDYPTMILGKSCKLLPVMFMSVLVHRATFPHHQYFAVGLVTLGVSGFMLLHDQEGNINNNNKGAPSSSVWGLFLLLINLLIDGLTNSTQDAMFKQFRITGQQMMVMMNFTSAMLMTLYLSIPALSNNELIEAWNFINLYPSVLLDMLLFALAGALGQVFIFHTLGRFGSLSLVTITVTRKMFSIILSVVMYNHQLTWGQWISVLVVFSGIAVESTGKSKSLGKGNVKKVVPDLAHLPKSDTDVSPSVPHGKSRGKTSSTTSAVNISKLRRRD